MILKIDFGMNVCYYECERVFTDQPKNASSDDFGVLTLRHESGTNSGSVEIDKNQNVGVYIMNNEGKTIDTIYNNR